MNHSKINTSLPTQYIRLLWGTKIIELMEVPSFLVKDHAKAKYALRRKLFIIIIY